MKRWITGLCAAMLLMCTALGCKSKDAGSVNTFDNVPLETIIEQIYETADLDLPSVGNITIAKENVSYYLGTDDFDFTEAVASEALISAIPFSMCLVRVTNPEEAADIAAKIQQSANPNKWICVCVDAENVLTDYAGDVVLLVMAEQAAALRAAFRKLAEA